MRATHSAKCFVGVSTHRELKPISHQFQVYPASIVTFTHIFPFPTRSNYDPDRFMIYGPTIRLPTSLPRSPRRRRPGGWTAAKAVTFIVTLAAHRNVTLAAARAGMSRKAAYVLKGREPAFAAAWRAALAAAPPEHSKSKVDSEVYNPPFAPPLGDSAARGRGRAQDANRRDQFFAALATRGRFHRTPSSQ